MSEELQGVAGDEKYNGPRMAMKDEEGQRRNGEGYSDKMQDDVQPMIVSLGPF